MGKRYLLDNDNLIFQEEHISFKRKAKGTIKYLLTGAAAALIMWSLFLSNTIESPENHILLIDNNNFISNINTVNTKFDSISSLLSDIQKRDDNFYRVISEENPISPTIRQAGFGGADRYKNLNSYVNSNLLIKSSLKGDMILSQAKIQSESYKTLIHTAQTKQDSLMSVPGISPVSPKGYYRISDPFGTRIHPITRRRQHHDGIDFAGKKGNSIYAVGNGKVIDVHKSRTGYGNKVTISHGYGYKTLYAHMNDIFVKKGDLISRGQTIGTIGTTGRSTGPHLHFEVIYNRKKVNPKYFYINDLTDDEYKGMAKLLSNN